MGGSISRRRLIKQLALGASALLAASGSQGANPKRLDMKNPAAVALGYVEDASLADTRKFPSYAKGSNCENCLQLQGTAGSAYRPCATFKGELVSIKGWCSAWTPEI